MRKRIALIIIVLGLLINLHAQKGERSIAAGLLVAFPEKYSQNFNFTRWKTGIGAEATGHLHFSDKSALLLQLQVVRFPGILYNGTNEYPTQELSTAVKAGYRYQFDPSGFFVHALVGLELSADRKPATIGAGKRFLINNAHFLDAGFEYTGGYIRSYRLRAVFSLLRRTGEN